MAFVLPSARRKSASVTDCPRRYWMDSAMADSATREQYQAPYSAGASWRPVPCRLRATKSGPPGRRSSDVPSQSNTRKSRMARSGVRVDVGLFDRGDHFGDPVAGDEVER